jgi:HSP20 family protein
MGRLSNIFPPMARLRQDIDRWLDRPFEVDLDVAGPEAFAGAYPAVNVWEVGGSVYVEAEVPGMAIDQIEVLVCGDQLTIRGDRPAVAPAAGSVIQRSERPTGPFSRAISLPIEVEAEKVEARLVDGVLIISCPISPRSQVRKISVSPA